MSEFSSKEQFCIGAGSMRGCRLTMEDFHTNILSLPGDPGTSFFAVYDGHGGDKVAKYANKNLHKLIVKRPEYKENTQEAIRQAFLDIDKELYSNYVCHQAMGSTAVVVLIKNNKLYCGNAGDSHAVASNNGIAEVLSVDHKPDNESESIRIHKAGGKVICHRVNSRLAVSRSLGDFIYKKDASRKPEEQIVTAYPDVETRDITEDYEFIVLASDGIWEVMQYQDVIEFCRSHIAKGLHPVEICEDLMNHCSTKTPGDNTRFKFGGDNMAVVMVCFLHGKSYEEYVDTIANNNILPVDSLDVF